MFRRRIVSLALSFVLGLAPLAAAGSTPFAHPTMTMLPRTVLLDNQSITLPIGQQTHGPFDIADGVNEIEFRIARSTTATPTMWPSASTQLTALVEVSYDGGATWKFEASFNSTGGIVVLRGIEVAESVLLLTGLPQTTGRKLRAKTQVTGGSLVTKLTIATS